MRHSPPLERELSEKYHWNVTDTLKVGSGCASNDKIKGIINWYCIFTKKGRLFAFLLQVFARKRDVLRDVTHDVTAKRRRALLFKAV